MSKFNNCILMYADTMFYEPEVEEYFPLDFKEVCEASLSEDMQPLGEEAIKSHLFGMAMVNSFMSAHWVQHKDVVGYAGVTGLEEVGGKKLAVVGGVITLPWYRGDGLGLRTVSGVLKMATLVENILEHGHEGFVAKCNEKSAPLFSKLGFVASGEERGKQAMTCLIDPEILELANAQKQKQVVNT